MQHCTTIGIDLGDKKHAVVGLAWSFHLADCFYPIPALHFAETFAALPASWSENGDLAHNPVHSALKSPSAHVAETRRDAPRT